jgi:hypothetical protein
MSPPKRAQLSRELVLTALTTGALLETAWTIYLAWRLPRHYTANHWDLAWVGLDSAQVLMLLLAAWAAWRRRAVLILFSCAAGTLLLVDAWFDVTTARYDEISQSFLSVAVEVPSALLLFWIAHHVVRRLGSAITNGGDPISVRRLPIPDRTDRSEPTQS